MKAPTQILPPSNWQDFEELCKRIWECKWNFPDDIIRNGRQGQRQNGVDISAYVESKKGYCGVQCKGKNNLTNKQMTIDEINEEIEEAKKFKPALKSFTFATTAPKDASIEEHVRCCNLENRKNKLFSVSIFSWDDIVPLIEQYKPIKDWYLNEKLQSFEPNIEILLNGEDATKESPVTLKPEYTEQYIFYEYNPYANFDFNNLVTVADYKINEKKGNIVKLKFDITNNGNFLENCIFNVSLKEDSVYKFHCENLYERINSQCFIENYHMQTKEFTLHGGFTKSIEFFIELPENPKNLMEKEIPLECCFTSKQNKKPFCKTLFFKSEPIITKLPQKIIRTCKQNMNNYVIEIKPKIID